MAKTIVGLYDHLTEAQKAVTDLQDQGFHREDISLVAHDTNDRFASDATMMETRQEKASGAAEGAGVGAVLGGLGGLLLGLGALAIPGIGPVVAAGPLLAGLAGAGVGAAAGGLVGALTDAGVPEEDAQYYAEGVRRGGTLVTVSAPDDLRAEQAVDIMSRYDPVDIKQRAGQWGDSTEVNENQGMEANMSKRKDQNWDRDRVENTEDIRSEQDSRKTRMDKSQERELGKSAHDLEAGEEAVLPVMEEHLDVDKEDVQQGVTRVHRTVTEKPVEETVHLREEHVNVERRPVDREVSPADLDTFQEETIEVPEMAERPVVAKDARVVEEVVVRKDATEHPETIRDTVRRTDVEAENVNVRGERGTSQFDTYDTDFRNHYTTTYASSGYSYDQFQPFYRYGYDLHRSDRYRGQDWSTAEPEIRRDWERKNPNNAWDDFKDAIRTGWDSVRGR